MVTVRVGAGVLAPARGGGVRAPDLAVPDQVLDAEPAGHRVAVAVLVGLEEPGRELLDPVPVTGLRRVQAAPVEGPTLLVLRGPADRAGPDDAEAAGRRVGAQQAGREVRDARLRRGGAGGLRLVASQRLDGRRVGRSGCPDSCRLGRDCGPEQGGEEGEDGGDQQRSGGAAARPGVALGHGVGLRDVRCGRLCSVFSDIGAWAGGWTNARQNPRSRAGPVTRSAQRSGRPGRGGRERAVAGPTRRSDRPRGDPGAGGAAPFGRVRAGLTGR